MSNLWTREENESLLQRLLQIQGSQYFWRYSLKNNHLLILYYHDHASYRIANPNSGVTSTEFHQYFAEDSCGDKILAIESMRLMREFPRVSRVQIAVPPVGSYKKIQIARGRLPESYRQDVLNPRDTRAWQWFCETMEYDLDRRENFLSRYGTRSGGEANAV